MNAIAVNLEKEFEALEPEDVQSIQRALLEMLAMARRKQPAPNLPPPGKRYEIQARPLGLKPGLSYDNIGELLTQAEGEDWK
ncbi:MAG: hypothetical protein K9N47_02370 [Prosthecobacter sp.]|uniref:hypothetical protein n=1 Tax=Prosthecobacter sp. TaxID=1965333 RepID=UPI0025EDBC58|nr:hypothetical protein [Prosthecobacter sp.]MCF7784934.1 hypothetical protein [Prosthecobacter sp.]